MKPKKVIQPISNLDDLRTAAPVAVAPAPEPQAGKGIQQRVDTNAVYAAISTTPQAPTEGQPPKRPSRLASSFKLRFLLYILLVGLTCVAYLTKDEYRNVSVIEPASLVAPFQVPTKATEFTYNHKGVDYAIKPLFEYELHGMVVSRKDYEKQHDADKIADKTLFPTDLCVIWGKNIASEVYKEDSVVFSQNGRFCEWTWQSGVGIDNDAASNSHLMFTSQAVKDKLKGIHPGDQISIKGKLVNVQTATPNPEPGRVVVRSSSIVRTDSGDGACEDIWVEDIVVLRKNTPLSQHIFTGGMIAIGSLAVLSLLVHMGHYVKARKHRAAVK